MSNQSLRIVLIGFGNMGQALVRGWMETAPELRLAAVDPSPDALAAATRQGIAAKASGAELDDDIDVVVLAVKPGQIGQALEGLPRARLYISIAAGRSLDDIGAAAGSDAAVVRAMPNTPAAIGQGITVLCANGNASVADRNLATRLMQAVGSVEWIEDEQDMDAVTAVSGSGPAYVFLLIECLTEAGVEMGLERALAERLATETVRGAGAYAAVADRDAAALRRQVTSPNGTTAAALEVLNGRGGFGELMRSAVRAATERSRKLRTGD